MTPLSDRANADVRADYEFSEEHKNEQFHAAVETIMREANEKEDYEECTDDVVFGMRLARRVRRISSIPGEHRDFTIRAYRKSGRDTEHFKLTKGVAKCSHYCVAWTNSWQMRELVVIDMVIFNKCYLASPIGKKDNKDGKTGFYWWPLATIPDCILKHIVYPFEWPSKPKCNDCWENRNKWVTHNDKVSCKVCGRFIGYKRTIK